MRKDTRPARRLGLGATVALLLLLACASAAQAAHPPAPTSAGQPLADGCQRSDLGIGFDTTPEWVYVYRNPAIRMAHGVVRVSHASLQDSILQHRSYDFNANLVPDAPFRYLIAGSPSRHTNNFAPGGGEESGRLHFEWESATLPLFAWPTDGDRATIWGSWIWDCGHWTTVENNSGGTVTGEHSELHPLSAIAVQRHASYASARGETQTDVFISSQGDAAHAVEQCALSHHPVAGGSFPAYDSGYAPCAKSVPNRTEPLARSYSFMVPAPPKPFPGARLQYHILTDIRGGSGSERVRTKANGIEVTVTVHGGSHVVSYGKSFFVSWTGPVRHAPVALKVTLKSIVIKHADPNPSVKDPSGAHWALYLDLNGYWQLLNQLTPALTTHVFDGQRIALNRTIKIYVPRGAGVWFQVAGRECDEPAGKVLFGLLTTVLYPCPANTDEQNPDILKLFGNDDTGTILDTFGSSGAALGTHVSTAAETTHRFPGSGAISFGNGNESQGNYQVTYTVRRG